MATRTIPMEVEDEVLACARELACISAALERSISPAGEDDDLILEHYMRSVDAVRERLLAAVGRAPAGDGGAQADGTTTCSPRATGTLVF